MATTREVIAQDGFPLSEAQKIKIASSCYPKLADAAVISRFIDKKLSQNDIRSAMADIFGTVGITPLFLLEQHRAHIEGVEYDKTFVDKDGEVQVVRVKDKPSYSALRDVEKLVFPAAPSKIQIDQRVLTGHIEPPVRNGPPKTSARLLGSARVEVEVTDHADGE